MTISITGIAASRGIAIGPAWIYRPVEIIIERLENAEPKKEWDRLQTAIKKANSQLEESERKALQRVGEKEAEIFGAHRMFLEDPELIGSIKLSIDHKLNAEAAVQEGIEGFAKTLMALESEYFQARADDVRDVGRRVVACLLGVNLGWTDLPQEAVVIFADDLNPSDTMHFETDRILGLCTRRGGPTSHTAILSRSLGVPAVVSTPFDIDSIHTGQMVVLNGISGEVILKPSKEQILEASKEREQIADLRAARLKKAGQPAMTMDGHKVKVMANIGSLADAHQAVEYGAEGIGLLRTEFLYMNREQLPDLGEQVDIYQALFDVMGTQPIVVRTLDIGGDKQVSYLGLKGEPNPFLGWRAIRMIGERPEVLRDQFQAILRAGVGRDLRIMLPLVSSVDEVIATKEIINEAMQVLNMQNIPFAEQVQFGIMVEVPSAALLIEHFAEYVDFFSIGTNDLAQYTLAVDRTNERVAALASPFHPAVIQLIARTIEQAHVNGKWVGLCGEMAGDPLATSLLLGLGLDEFSMAPFAVPKIKETIRGLDKQACEKIAANVLLLSRTSDVISHLQDVV